MLRCAPQDYNVSAFVAHSDLPPGFDWFGGIADQLHKCAVIVAMATTSYGAEADEGIGTISVRSARAARILGF